MRYARLATPIGDLVLSGERVLAGVWFDQHRGSSPIGAGWIRDDDLFADAREQLVEYLGSNRRSFDLEARPEGTAFQQRVWTALGEIPYGGTRTYADLASALGTSARAVGHANARNPLSIVVPCHRVIGAAGLTGYAGGLDRKRFLLDLEMARNVGSRS
jgi:methylated-DNA-[protein]-cysteine S-methyltransferase